jgi:hypothetical protein
MTFTNVPRLLMLVKKQTFVLHPRIGRKNCIFIISGGKIAQSLKLPSVLRKPKHTYSSHFANEISFFYGVSLTLTLFSGLRERALVGLAGALTGDRTPPPPTRTADRVVSGAVALDMQHPMSIF